MEVAGKWLQNFPQNRKQQILIEKIKSTESKVLSGSVQGSVLEPVLFLIFIGNLTENKTASTKLFVDDAKVKKHIMSEGDVENLQHNSRHPVHLGQNQQNEIQW